MCVIYHPMDILNLSKLVLKYKVREINCFPSVFLDQFSVKDYENVKEQARQIFILSTITPENIELLKEDFGLKNENEEDMSLIENIIEEHSNPCKVDFKDVFETGMTCEYNFSIENTFRYGKDVKFIPLFTSYIINGEHLDCWIEIIISSPEE